MLPNAALAFANHLLDGAAWARARLKPFAGQTAAFRMGPLSATVAVDGSGFLARSHSESAAAAVTIDLPADTPLRWLSDRSSIFAAARISGTADFAETLGFVFRNLRWDAEEDLSRVVGDVLAHRFVRTATGFADWQKATLRKVGKNFLEFLTEERPTLTRSNDFQRFSEEVDAARQECDRLEARIQRLAPGR